MNQIRLYKIILILYKLLGILNKSSPSYLVYIPTSPVSLPGLIHWLPFSEAEPFEGKCWKPCTQHQS